MEVIACQKTEAIPEINHKLWDQSTINSINRFVNRQRLEHVVGYVQSSGVKNVGIYRAQMKQGSDNARESVSLRLLEKLVALTDVRIYEPRSNFQKMLSNLRFLTSLILVNGLI